MSKALLSTPIVIFFLVSCGRHKPTLGHYEPPTSTVMAEEDLGQPCGVVNGAQKFCKNARVSSYVAGIDTFRTFHNVGRSTYDMANHLPVIWGIYKNSPEAWFAADPGGCAVFGPYLDLPGPGQVSADFHLYSSTGNTGLPAPNEEMFTIDLMGPNVPGDVKRTFRFQDFAQEVLIGHHWQYFLPGQGSPIPWDNGINPQKNLKIFSLSTRVEAAVNGLEARICGLNQSVAVVVGKIVITFVED